MNFIKPVISEQKASEIFSKKRIFLKQSPGEISNDKKLIYIIAGNQADGILYQGRKFLDYLYDGVWKAVTSMGEEELVVEMEIPFRSINYNVVEWDLQPSRWIEKKREDVYFKEVSEMKGLHIEDFESISCIYPKTRGRFIEFFSVISLLHNPGFHYNFGIDVSWDPSTDTSFDLISNPDYAQIEADPFQVNLSQYALYLREKRHFFLEGVEIFNLSPCEGSLQRGLQIRNTQCDLYDHRPYELFYSRNIGETIDPATKVPVRLEAKITTRGKGIDIWILFANTGKASNLEPTANYFAGRLVKQIPFGLNAGFFYYGKYTENDIIQLVGMDGYSDFGDNIILYQFAIADSSGVRDHANYLEWKRVTENFRGSVAINMVGEDFRAN